ncbi:MAG: SPOR domain-containing protein [Pseudomonadaceae bacterium]|nr:SPOR domain-containing protein [Pseudomonadaceae bacterium]
MMTPAQSVTRRSWVYMALALLVMLLVATSYSAHASNADNDRISLNLKDMDIASVMEMLARKYRINILLGDDVEGDVSLNLFDVTHDAAITAIAEAAGYAVEKRRDSYFILPPDSVGRFSNGVTQVQRFHINYADPEAVSEMIESHLSEYGNVTVLPERNLIIVADKPRFLQRISRLVSYADTAPQQVLIEAQILEVTLSDEDSYGINWAKLFDSDGGEGQVGARGFLGAGNSGNTGFLFELLTPNVDIQLSALQQEGRVRTLSSPKLVALDSQEASVVIGDRRGYQVTTTINQVTSESIEFLESGVILRVTPKIDASGNILMDIHPEVSTGTVDANGIPSQTTTEVTTTLLIPDGETVFIGGLIKHTQSQSYQRVPVLGRVPVVKTLFRNKERSNVNTETVVLITPRLVSSTDIAARAEQEGIDEVDDELNDTSDSIEYRVLHEESTLLDDPVSRAKRSKGFDTTAVELPSKRGGPVAGEPATAPAFAATAHVAQVTESGGTNEHSRSAEPSTRISDTVAPPEAQGIPSDASYAVQLMMMSDQAALKTLLQRREATHLPYVKVKRRTGHAYALMLGYYDSYRAAAEAAQTLPEGFEATEPWIRSTEELAQEVAAEPSSLVANAR